MRDRDRADDAAEHERVTLDPSSRPDIGTDSPQASVESRDRLDCLVEALAGQITGIPDG